MNWVFIPPGSDSTLVQGSITRRSYRDDYFGATALVAGLITTGATKHSTTFGLVDHGVMPGSGVPLLQMLTVNS